MNQSIDRPGTITIAAILIGLYAGVVIAWDLVAPFERPYAQGPVSVVAGIRVFGIWAQMAHMAQLFVAMALAYGLWTMREWAWGLAQFVAGYMLISIAVWMTVYQEFERIKFAFFYIVVVNLLLALVFPHREKFKN
ncbi:MAG: hypothetical protein AB7G75_07690 [Candidatus Binatia bacterium]